MVKFVIVGESAQRRSGGVEFCGEIRQIGGDVVDIGHCRGDRELFKSLGEGEKIGAHRVDLMGDGAASAPRAARRVT